MVQTLGSGAGGGTTTAWCSWWCGAAPVLLPHVNLLLSLYAGAGLAMAARLKWDPTTNLVREVFPVEYFMLLVFFCVGGFTLLVLGHLCATALRSPPVSARRPLLILYAVMMAALAAGELAWTTWMGFRIAVILRSDRAALLVQFITWVDDFKNFLEQWSWLEGVNRIKGRIEEVQDDVLSNFYVAGACVGLLCLLQLLAITLALVAASSSKGTKGLLRRSYSCAMAGATASVEKLVQIEGDAENAPRALLI